jgi:hypothetical protein
MMFGHISYFKCPLLTCVVQAKYSGTRPGLSCSHSTEFDPPERLAAKDLLYPGSIREFFDCTIHFSYYGNNVPVN